MSSSALLWGQVLIEQEFLHHLAEHPVVRDALVQVEVRVNDLLTHVLHFLVKGEPHVFVSVHARRGIHGGIVVQPLHHLAQSDAVRRSEVEPESLVEFRDDARESLDLLHIGAVARFC